jgi:hypothetical protein
MIDCTQTNTYHSLFKVASPAGPLVGSIVYLLMPPQIVIRGGGKVRQDPSIGMSGVRGVPKVEAATCVLIDRLIE